MKNIKFEGTLKDVLIFATLLGVAAIGSIFIGVWAPAITLVAVLVTAARTPKAD